MATQQLKRAILVLLATSCLTAIQARADDSESQIQSGKTLLNEALESNDRQKLDTAATIFQAQLDKPGFDQSTLVVQVSNTAQLYQNFEQQKQSLDWWQRLIKIEPENWRAWAKVVQCSQALSNVKQRDDARDRVIELYKQGKVDQKCFCREQFFSGDKKIMALEYFKPDTELGVEMVFRVSSKTAPEVPSRRYTLGEIASDTQVARELKEIGPNDHMYSIDGFDQRGQWLLSMTTKKPSYEQLRAMVVADLEKARPAAPGK
jgi:tetratricopeptide (TPR) repeat protein